MKEVTGDIFKHKNIVVTTNGVVKSNGQLVMGAGIAKTFKEKFVGIDGFLGNRVRLYGNICYIIRYTDYNVISFPTKHDWKDNSDIELIKKSCNQIMKIADSYKLLDIHMPRPGCSNGGLSWEHEVKPAIAGLLDNRFFIHTI